MTAPLSIRKVDSKADFKTLITFPWTLYKDDPYWVPPMMSMQRHKFNQQKSSSWKHMTGEYFIAWRGDRPIGTIAGFVNHRHNEFHEENIGFFGAFEVFDDQEAAHALLNTAVEVVRSQGCDAIRGPASSAVSAVSMAATRPA